MTTPFLQPLQWLDDQRLPMATLLHQWSAINTGTYHVAGLRHFATELSSSFARLGTPIARIPLPPHTLIDDHGQPESRPLAEALHLQSPVRQGPRVLLGIHTDTVYSPQHPFQTVTQPDDHILRGPGVCDAKGGLVVLLFALLTFERSPFANGLNWEILLNPDEEIGSPGSHPLFTTAAQRNDLGLLFEPALPDGSLVSSRKGVGTYTLIVHGRAAHAGRDPLHGRNAIVALAQLIQHISDLNHQVPGAFANVGFIHGGGPANIVPDFALCRINFRVETPAQQLAIESQLAQLPALPDGFRIEVHGHFTSPPKTLTPAVETLLSHFQSCGHMLDLPLSWHATGGASDGNRLAAAGLPTLDSLGVRGGLIHTDQEFTQLDSLVERARLTALFLMRLAAGDITPPPKTSEVPQS